MEYEFAKTSLAELQTYINFGWVSYISETLMCYYRN